MLALLFFAAMLLFAAAEASAVQVIMGGKQVNVPVCGGFAGMQCDRNE